MQIEVCKLIGKKAKFKGKSKKWWKNQTLYWKGNPMKIDDRLYDINGVVFNTNNYIQYSLYYNKKTFNRQFKRIYTN